MKKTFTAKDLLENTKEISEQITELYSAYDKNVTVIDVLENNIIPSDEKVWVLYNICELTTKQKIELSYTLGKAVAPIFNEKYPDDNCVNEYWQAIDDFKNKLISKEQLLGKRNAVDEVISVIAYYPIRTFSIPYYVTNIVYYVITALCHNITDVEDVEYSVRTAAYYAIDTALESEDPVYINLLNQLMIDFVNNN